MTIYKRKDHIWPWGYYIPPQKKLKQGQYGHFVAKTKKEAIKQVNRNRNEKKMDSE